MRTHFEKPIIPLNRDGFAPGMLWSLWDIMNPIELDGMLHTLVRMSSLREALQYEAARALNLPTFIKLGNIELEEIDVRMKLVHTFASAHGFDVLAIVATDTADAFRRLKSDVARFGDHAEIEGLRAKVDYFNRVFTDTFKSRKMLSLSVAEQELIAPNQPLFGSEVDTKFAGSAQEDIAEAGKCLAMGCYTASVFHLMRAMESAVKILSTHLGSANVEKEWGKLISDINRKVEPMPKGELRQSWSEVVALLYHVKEAWRNTNMHPKQTYTKEEAKNIFVAVKMFMIRLAALV